jgi:hypothetical protein
VPSQVTERIPSEGLLSDLSVVVRPFGFGLQTLGAISLRCGRLACGLVGSTDWLVKRAITLGAEREQTGERDARAAYSLHWISRYESDAWD